MCWKLVCGNAAYLEKLKIYTQNLLALLFIGLVIFMFIWRWGEKGKDVIVMFWLH